MTLHEAIEKLLQQTGCSMTTREIADALNKNKWYQKKDGSLIEPFQIHCRTRNYAQLFNRNGSTVSLIDVAQTKPVTAKPKTVKQRLKVGVKTNNIKPLDCSTLEKVLLNEKNFKSVATIDIDVPHCCGLYCIRIIDKTKLPSPFNQLLSDRGHNIIYIGIASTSLNSRFLNQELRANGHGTFFRSIGAVLGYKPPKGSLREKANKRNYKFSPTDEKKIIEWINNNLVVNWVATDKDFEVIETFLLDKYRPLLNLAKNPSALVQLSELRAECVRIANSI